MTDYENKLAERQRLMAELAAAKRAQAEAEARLGEVRRHYKLLLDQTRVDGAKALSAATAERDQAKIAAGVAGSAYAALMSEMEGMRPTSAAASKKKRKAANEAESVQRHADKVEFSHLLPADFFSPEDPSPLDDQQRADLREFGRLVGEDEDREALRAEIRAALGGGPEAL